MKQMTKILSEVNFDTSSIKLVKCLAVHNEKDWVEYNLANNYDEFDIIRVIEGAVEGRPNATPDGHSTDGTLDIVRNFPDPKNKIELYTINRPFKSLEEQKQIFLDVASENEWLFIVDCDEFYLEGDVDRVRKAIYQHPTASEFIPTFLHFYRDFGHIRDFAPEWVLNHQRIIRYRSGMRYHTHPVATLADGRCTYFTPELQPERYTLPVFIFHYGHAKGAEYHAMKRDFYLSELSKFPAGEGKTAADAFDEKFKEFATYTENLAEVLSYNGPHPHALNTHPSFKHRDSFYSDKDIKNFKSSKYYSVWPHLPTIPQWMWEHSKARRMNAFYNLVEV